MTATAAAPAANSATLDQLRHNQVARVPESSDQMVSMFSLRGFELAQRIARALSTSNAVPAPFRQFIEKKGRDGNFEYIENPSAMGNCLIAIETAQAIGVSITAVMQNANMIEGRLTWSGQYKIAAINASHRFTPLRFQVINRGIISAKYREKQGWNKEKRGFDFIDRTVEIENLECIAWALPGNVAMPATIRTLQQARDANLPVIESAPVSMKMAVEEGWYSKPGSKWQTEMKHLMLQYRAGSFFGNIHAPDIVMGMGRTTEEVADAIVLDVDQQGRVTNVSTEDLRTQPLKSAEVVQKHTAAGDDADDAQGAAEAPAADAAAAGAAKADPSTKAFDIEVFADRLAACTSVEVLDVLMDEMRQAGCTDEQKAVLTDVYTSRRDELEPAAAAASGSPAPTQAPTPTASRRRAAASAPSVE